MRKQKPDKERKLTAAEQRRKERFDELKAGLERDGYVAQDLTIGIARATVLSILVMLPFVAIITVWYIWVNDTLGGDLSLPALLFMLALLIILTVVHELIHGLVWGCCDPYECGLVAFERPA